MGMTDQVIRETQVPVDSDLNEIELIVGRARNGSLTEEAAFEAIGRVLRRRTADETYQKPWG